MLVFQVATSTAKTRSSSQSLHNMTWSPVLEYCYDVESEKKEVHVVVKVKIVDSPDEFLVYLWLKRKDQTLLPQTSFSMPWAIYRASTRLDVSGTLHGQMGNADCCL